MVIQAFFFFFRDLQSESPMSISQNQYPKSKQSHDSERRGRRRMCDMVLLGVTQQPRSLDRARPEEVTRPLESWPQQTPKADTGGGTTPVRADSAAPGGG